MKQLLSLILFSLFIVSCSKQPDAEKIVQHSIKVHGGELIDRSIISFDFRGVNYMVHRDRGMFTYERVINDSTGRIHDFLNNDFFVRELDGQHYRLSSADSIKYSNSINSVVYFALLPYFLKDPAVLKKYMGTDEIDGKTYHKIRIGFNADGGGKDFEDEYVYWIDTETGHMDFLAYKFYTDNGGTRFRQAINRREINGITFQDYINFAHPDKEIDISEYPLLWKRGEAEEISRVILNDVRVRFP
jgi:hypothetical protein